MTINELIEILRYKADNIKAKIHPDIFSEAANKLEKQVIKFVECNEYKGQRYTRYKCPNCKSIVKACYSYCTNCGQAIKFPKLKKVNNKIEFDWSEIE